MRAIKFRAFHKQQKKMEEVCRIIFFGKEKRGNYCQVRFLFGCWWLVPQEAILVQSTGLCDKNSKEIYEGDVVRIMHALYGIDEPRYRIAEITKSCSFCAIPHPIVIRDGVRQVEVIGNIHENPELMEQPK